LSGGAFYVGIIVSPVYLCTVYLVVWYLNRYIKINIQQYQNILL
jgi:hypothetical protein